MNTNVALVTVMMISTFILSLVLNLTGQQKPNENQELQDGSVQQIAVDTEMATVKGRSEADLGEPCNSTLQDMVLAALRKMITHEGDGGIPEGANTQILPLQTCGDGNHQQKAMEWKTELKVGLMVVSVSTTAIIGFLGAFTGSQTSGRRKHDVLRAGMLLMVGSFCSAVMLLLLLAFRASSVFLVKTSVWICTGSMVVSLLLLSVFYFQAT